MDFNTELGAGFSAGAEMNNSLKMGRVMENHWIIECRDLSGKFKWREEFDNLVTTAGLNDSLTNEFKASAYTAAWFVGLTGSSPTFAAGDTMASHAGWTEGTAFSNASRPALTLGAVAAGSVDNSASKAVFNINGTATMGGAFVTTGSAISGSIGVLYGEGSFAANRAVLSGDTLNVTVTLTAA